MSLYTLRNAESSIDLTHIAVPQKNIVINEVEISINLCKSNSMNTNCDAIDNYPYGDDIFGLFLFNPEQPVDKSENQSNIESIPSKRIRFAKQDELLFFDKDHTPKEIEFNKACSRIVSHHQHTQDIDTMCNTFEQLDSIIHSEKEQFDMACSRIVSDYQHTLDIDTMCNIFETYYNIQHVQQINYTI